MAAEAVDDGVRGAPGEAGLPRFRRIDVGGRASVPIPKFGLSRGTLAGELRSRKRTFTHWPAAVRQISYNI
jgi:hypothetical protein